MEDAPKIHVDSLTEFGYELQLVIPYAYYLYLNNKLEATTSCELTKELYYFSPKHCEKHKIRRPLAPNTPNKTPHTLTFDYTQWVCPPYKEIYKNDIFVFNKPLLIVHNKFNIEWFHRPVNYLDIPTLNTIFDTLKHKYTIVYIRPPSNLITEDKSRTLNLRFEEKLIRKHRIITGTQLYNANKEKCNNFNHFQLLLHANCNNFISVQGGNSVIASYFGGKNIIYAKGGNELWCDSYNNLYKKYSNCEVYNANNYIDFLDLVKAHF